MSPEPKIKLTQTVAKGGCAAKVAAAELRSILSSVRFPPAPPELMVDGRHFDDAAVYRVSDTVAMVQTIDFFTPIVDTPADFGRIAAANAISDVYAMGGRPVTALAVLGFPLGSLPNSTVAEILQGACEVIESAGASLGGGHSIDDDTLKFGLSVTGFVHPDRVWTNAGVRAGDALILTKGLGTGTLTAALKRGALSEDEIRHAIDSMSKLNNVIDPLSKTSLGDDLSSRVHAATDITGFGLAGHSMQMAIASEQVFEIEMTSVPRLAGAEECLKKEFLTKAHRTNREYTAKRLILDTVSHIDQLLAFDPQTSGGLLLAVDPSHASAVVDRLKNFFPSTNVVGYARAPKRDEERGLVVLQ
jgi:selenide,water dikinase